MITLTRTGIYEMPGEELIAFARLYVQQPGDPEPTLLGTLSGTPEQMDTLANTMRTHDRLAQQVADLRLGVLRLMDKHALPGMMVLVEVAAERGRQDAQWGEQNHPDGTGPDLGAWGRYGAMSDLAAEARRACQHAASEGKVTWFHILREEYAEAMAEADPDKLRAELVQTAAVIVAWIEAIDRREGTNG